MAPRLLFLLAFLASLNYGQSFKYVNPFIGTSNGGNTFPGAVLPWGMVSVSPHNCTDCPSGYRFGEKSFYGLGHTHLSGTGCADFGSIILTAGTGKINTDPELYKQPYTNEKAEVGYYTLHLDKSNLTLEAAATLRCGITKIVSDKDQSINVLIDVGKSLAITGGGEINILSDSTVEGYNISGGFCGEANREKIYFFAEFSQKAEKNGIWKNNLVSDAKKDQVVDSSLGSWHIFNLKKGESVLIKVGISYTSTENAKLNLKSEIPGWDFDSIKDNAREAWEEVLSRVTIYDDNDSGKTIFYTALYHALIHPNIINDVNGDYPLMGRKGTGNYKKSNRYSVFSLWDTYRTLHPLLTLLYPERESEIVATMIDMSHENGYLPKWELAGNETYMMVGDPADIVIADSYIKGIRDFDGAEALAEMMKPGLLESNQQAPPVRAGYHQLLAYGYIPIEQNWNDEWWVWGPVSTTLEYCYSDWAIAQMSKVLNRTNDYNMFLRRSSVYKNLYDSATTFFRPKSVSGQFAVPFDSLATEGAGDWKGAGGPGYVEGNAWDYAFYVPFDVERLINLYGGPSKFYKRLDRYFNGRHFSLNNEPAMSYPYLYAYINGKEVETQKLVEKILGNSFNTGTGGLPGNDDCGAISAWYLFSSMGFYPLCPASEEYILGIPEFNKIAIKLNQNYYPGKEIIIEKNSNRPVSGRISIDGQKATGYKVNHNQLIKGASIKFN
jgi:predicted alpha-1,2-mannosidase